MFDCVSKILEEHSLSLKEKNLVIAVSGGRDSMAMLHFFSSEMKKFGINSIAAVHFNHGLRGEESDLDERLVKTFSGCLNIPFDAGAGEMSAKEKPKGLSEESWARELRYNYLREAADKNDAYIATAHTKDDQAETVLLFLLRGTGLRGASGIPFQNKNIIRPFLGISRSEIDRYVSENKIPYRDDSSNSVNVYSRNRIRNIVLPELLTINSNAIGNIVKFSKFAGQADDYFKSEAKRLLDTAKKDNGYDCGVLLSCPLILQTYILKMICAEAGQNADERMTEEMLSVLRGEKNSAQLRGHKRFSRRNDIVLIEKAQKIWRRAKRFSFEVLALPGETAFPGEQIIVMEKYNLLKESGVSAYNAASSQDIVDCDKIIGVPMLRNRREGDSFQSFKKGQTKSIKKLFNEMGIPVEHRYFVPMLSDDLGVLWIHGIGTSKRGYPDESSTNVLRMIVKSEL